MQSTFKARRLIAGAVVAVVALAAMGGGVARAAATVATGEAQSCAIFQGGAVKCWGSDSGSARGDGPGGEINSAAPTQVVGLTSGATAVALTTTGDGSNSYGCAIVRGALKCWGINSASGTLGNGTTTKSDVPVQVTGLESGVTDVSLHASHACAIQNGLVKCWGGGILGREDITSSLVPVTVPGIAGATSVSMAWRSACAVAGGAVYCWGNGIHGQLGTPTPKHFEPTPVVGLPGPVVKVAGGLDHMCALTQAGAVYCWGYNGSEGYLGTGTSLLLTNVPQQVVGLTSGVTDIYGNWMHTCANRGGQMLCWGSPRTGALGNGSPDIEFRSNVPVAVVGLKGVTSAATGRSHTCAAADGGSLWCWGLNDAGQLGTKAVASWTSTPVRVIGTALAPTVAPTAKTQRVSTLRRATLATIKCPAGSDCTVTAPKTVNVTIAGKRYAVSVLVPKSIKAGKTAQLRVQLTSAAHEALRGRTTTVKVTVTVKGSKSVTTKVTTTLRGQPPK